MSTCVGCGKRSAVIVSKVALCEVCADLYHKIRRAMTRAFFSKSSSARIAG